VSEALKRLGPQVQQAEMLAMQYDAVVANPPYMGGRYQTAILKKFLKDRCTGYEKDFFSAFIDRDLAFAKSHGRLGFMSPFVWMFISSHEHLRTRLINLETITSLVQLEYSGFDGATVPVCTFTLQKGHIDFQKGCYIRLADFRGSENQGPRTLEAIRNRDCGWFFEVVQDDFAEIEGAPVAYWVPRQLLLLAARGRKVGEIVTASNGIQTGDNETFVRLWHEVDSRTIGDKWFPYNKGGPFRRWYGNNTHVVFWKDEGRDIRMRENCCIRGERFYFQPGVTWSDITSAINSFRAFPSGYLFDAKGPSAFPRGQSQEVVLGLLNASITHFFSKALNPTLSFQIGDLRRLPFVDADESKAKALVSVLVSLFKADWDAFESSTEFRGPSYLQEGREISLERDIERLVRVVRREVSRAQEIEVSNNQLWVAAFKALEAINCDVPIEQITLTVNPAYRYGGKLSEEELWTRFRQDTMAELVSYAIGCMMGRYSLDAPGLIYAHSGNIGFDASRYTRFPADADGIVPITDELWFEDDAALRVREFLLAVWGAASLEQNMAWLADTLGRKASESPDESVRRYLADKFFKDHLQTYKKRPIYWLFSSGKQGAFQALVYLHRYNGGTLSRLRAEYVIPLTGKMLSRIEQLERDAATASSTAARNRFNKQLESLRKKHQELLTYDEQLRHYADQRIELDLDDGVKVNYGKFGDLLAEVKSVVGKQEEE
jgi:hypothetical protein